jgi:hypothetical protein
MHRRSNWVEGRRCQGQESFHSFLGRQIEESHALIGKGEATSTIRATYGSGILGVTAARIGTCSSRTGDAAMSVLTDAFYQAGRIVEYYNRAALAHGLVIRSPREQSHQGRSKAVQLRRG